MNSGKEVPQFILRKLVKLLPPSLRIKHSPPVVAEEPSKAIKGISK